MILGRMAKREGLDGPSEPERNWSSNATPGALWEGHGVPLALSSRGNDRECCARAADERSKRDLPESSAAMSRKGERIGDAKAPLKSEMRANCIKEPSSRSPGDAAKALARCPGRAVESEAGAFLDVFERGERKNAPLVLLLRVSER